MTHEKSVFENEPDNTAFECFDKLSPEKRRELRRLMRRIIDDNDDDEALVGRLLHLGARASAASGATGARAVRVDNSYRGRFAKLAKLSGERPANSGAGGADTGDGTQAMPTAATSGSSKVTP